MFGRYERCVDEGLRAVLGTLVSRVHLLLLLERDGVHGYDLCSTNGTWLPGARLRHIRLGREPVRLWIGGIDGTEMLWLA
jgi:pSer/pThr/pTyr-binding forkhead associated (FHA) protein